MNIIADALAHHEKVLVVCQKRAAIDVVARRLHAAGLNQLCSVVHDSEGDRTRIILGLKEQIAAVGQESRHANGEQRSILSAEIEKRETELDSYYKALQVPRLDTGLSYRSVVSRLGIAHSFRIPAFIRIGRLENYLNTRLRSVLEDSHF